MSKKIRSGVARKNEKQREESGVLINKNVAVQNGITSENSDLEHPYFSLKYYDYDYCCFSELSKEELKKFTNLSRKFRSMTWLQIKNQGGKKQKCGLGLTPINRDSLPQKEIKEVSEDVRFLEIRLSKKARIFGFRSHATFFIVFIDRNHKEF